VILAGQVIDGACVSVTVTLKPHEPVLPLASVAEQITVVVPFGKLDPLAGTQVTELTPEQLSMAVGAA
jgi:hypothetical protein